ncbi:MAG: TetR/AcrR family transcriptional regulator [Alphaproteobacteria bacterium]|nr:TetR/AcrR family transcriptional regulator [Alphaproteobacteria bacterium]
MGSTAIKTVEPEGRQPDRGVARRQAFLQAAREVFLEHGYEAASVNDVVRLAGGSLATLYAQFGNKEGLFLAFMQDQHDRFAREMRPSQDVDGLPLEKALQVVGEHFLRRLLQRDSLSFFRVMVSEGRKLPAPMRRYFASGGANMIFEELAKLLRDAGLSETDATESVTYFIDLLRSQHHFQALSVENYEISDADLKAHVARAVRFLLNGLKLS